MNPPQNHTTIYCIGYKTKIIPRLNSCPSVSVLGPVTVYYYHHHYYYYFSLATTLFILIENKEKERGVFPTPIQGHSGRRTSQDCLVVYCVICLVRFMVMSLRRRHPRRRRLRMF